MWLVRCPYVDDPEDGRIPKIAADLGCAFDGASSQLDTGIYAPATRQALVVVDIAPHHVQGWARSQTVDVDVRRIGAGSEVSDIRAAKRLDPPVRRTKTRRDGTTFDILEPPPLRKRSAAHAEYRAAIREAASGVLRPYQIAFGAQMLVPFIATLGAYGAARALGVPVDALLALLASYGLSVGSILASHDFTGSSGTELDGDALDTGGTWDVVEGTGVMRINASNEAERISAKSNHQPTAMADGVSGTLGDQYAQVVVSDATSQERVGPAVRVTDAGGAAVNSGRGYSAMERLSQLRIYADNTQIGSGSMTVAQNDTLRLEIIDDDLEGFQNGVSRVTALNDTTYSTGRPGFVTREVHAFNYYEAGDFSAGGGGAPVDLLRSHLLTSNLIRGLAR